ncbi:MAG: hypothetical protein R3C44_00715 [Chloroflexota bacterium]
MQPQSVLGLFNHIAYFIHSRPLENHQYADINQLLAVNDIRFYFLYREIPMTTLPGVDFIVAGMTWKHRLIYEQVLGLNFRLAFSRHTL